ncbi:Mce protein [Mycobacterium sp.]|uniref:Mce protein n=1 Tax=Mycobacterium sp. TaxID=1785 RepID=UPI003C77A3D4
MGLPRDPASAAVDDENDHDKPVQDLRAKRARATRLRGLAAAALVIVLACAGYEGWLLFQRQQADAASQQALAVAEKYVVMLTSVDSDTLDKHVADVLDGSAGEFNDNYARIAGGQHGRHVVNDKVKTHGKVVESAVKSATTNKVQVLLMVDQSVSSLASPEPQIDRSRIKMTVQKIDGRWLVSKVELL